MRARGIREEPFLAFLDSLPPVIQIVDADVYSQFRAAAANRLRTRDPDDWPVLALALAFDCPVRTEDQDVFGCGVATWATDRVEEYLLAACDEV